MTTGKRIKTLRERLHIPQTELAESIHISKQTLYKYENDIVTNIPSDKLESIADKLDTTPEYLMGWTEDPVDYDKLEIDIPSWWEGTVKGYIEFQNALQKDQEYDSSINNYWEAEKKREIDFDEFIHSYLGYESPYTPDGKSIDIKLNCETNIIYRVSSEEYENFYEYTKDRIDSEFKYLLGKAQKLSTNKLQDFPSTVQEPQADYLTANAAHERTDTDFTEEERKADEDMLD